MILKGYRVSCAIDVLLCRILKILSCSIAQCKILKFPKASSFLCLFKIIILIAQAHSADKDTTNHTHLVHYFEMICRANALSNAISPASNYDTGTNSI